MTVFQLLAEVQVALGRGGVRFRAFVAPGAREPSHVLRIEAVNPGHAFALLDAVGGVFGECNVVGGCESCGFDSVVEVDLYRVLGALAERSRPTDRSRAG
jgi:hypothetical protein